MYQTEYESESRGTLSVGEDLENFIQRIKNGKMNKNMVHMEEGEGFTSFMLCLLDKEEGKKLEQKDEDFMKTFSMNRYRKADVPEAEWKASESNLKFSQSYCSRETHYIDASYVSLSSDTDMS